MTPKQEFVLRIVNYIILREDRYPSVTTSAHFDAAYSTIVITMHHHKHRNEYGSSLFYANTVLMKYETESYHLNGLIEKLYTIMDKMYTDVVDREREYSKTDRRSPRVDLANLEITPSGQVVNKKINAAVSNFMEKILADREVLTAYENPTKSKEIG